MTSSVNRQWILRRHPERGDVMSEEFLALEEAEIPEPRDGEFLVRTICLGTSPAQFGYMIQGKSTFGSLKIGDVMRGRGVGEVIQSKHPDFKSGDLITSSLGWQDYSIQPPRDLLNSIKSVQKVENPVAPLSTTLGILGTDGFTPYFGLLDVGQAKAGDTVVISAAGGGIGSVAGQIAKIKGCRAIGITGSADKAQWITEELGFDHAINYKTEDVSTRLGKLCPEGVDVFFDNVGGDILDAVLLHLAVGARIAICGYISIDYMPLPRKGPSNYTELLNQRSRMQGFMVFDYLERWPEAEAQMRNWYMAGLLKNSEDVSEGLENMPEALASLFKSENKGIKSLRVGPDPEWVKGISDSA